MAWRTVKPSPARHGRRSAAAEAPSGAHQQQRLRRWHWSTFGSTPRHASASGQQQQSSADGGEQGGGMCRSGGAQQLERLRERTSCSASATGQVIRTALQQAHRRTIGAWAAKQSM